MAESQHKYHQLANEVERMIKNQKLKPHDPVFSEGELAKMFNVSTMTAKMALKHLAIQGVVYRMSRRGTFLCDSPSEIQINDVNKELPFGAMKSISIGMIVPDLDSYISQMISTIESEARAQHYNLMIKISRGIEDEDSCLRQLVDERIEGIIWFPRARDYCSQQVLRLKMEGYPIVMIDRYFPEVLIDCVYPDYFEGTYQMVEHLIHKGHREIGIVTNAISAIGSSEDQYQGYFKALFDHEITAISKNIHIIEKTKDRTNYSDKDPLLDRFLRENPDLTAIICGDDHIAASVLYSAMRLNILVPNQLSIAGFSDIQLAMMLPVALTTVRQPTEELGKEAVKLLIRRMNHCDEKQNTVKLKTQIIERDSVSVRS